MITRKQQQSFFIYARQIGINRARQILLAVTRGKTSSTRDPRLTPFQMKIALDECQRISNLLLARPRPRQKAKTKTENNIVHLRTGDQKDRVKRLQEALNWSDDKIQEFTRLLINRDYPLSEQEAGKVIEGLEKIAKKMSIKNKGIGLSRINSSALINRMRV